MYGRPIPKETAVKAGPQRHPFAGSCPYWNYQDGHFKKKKKKCCHSGPSATASSTLRSGPLLKLQMLRRPILGGPFPKQLNLKPCTLEMFSGSVGFQEKRCPVIPRGPLPKLWPPPPPEMKSWLRHWLRYWYPNRWQKYGVVHLREWQFGKFSKFDCLGWIICLSASLIPNMFEFLTSVH